VREWRPALVVASGALEEQHGLAWVLMITSAKNRGWPEDVEISDIEAAGLPVASVVRAAKIATIEAGEAERIGILPLADRVRIGRHVAKMLVKVLVVPKRRDNHHG
jgi:PemK-like protein.